MAFPDKIQDFSMVMQPGADCTGIQTGLMINMAQSGDELDEQDLQELLEEHQAFFKSGGMGGTWETYVVGGIVFGLYNHSASTQGEQLNLNLKNIARFKRLPILEIPFAYMIGLYAPGFDFSRCDLSGSCMTDSQLEGSNFESANLERVDFSRAILKGANFQNAMLAGADFENCDLKGADFRGAVLRDARFPGANINGVWR